MSSWLSQFNGILRVLLRLKALKEERTGAMVLHVDNTVIEGAFYLNCALIWKASDQGSPGIVHSHDNYDEYVGFMGSNPEDPHDLCGEVEFWLDDERHMLTKSCAVFIPKGLLHCPIYFRRVDRPIFYFSTAPSITYGKDLLEWFYIIEMWDENGCIACRSTCSLRNHD